MEEIKREQLVAPLSYTREAPPGIGGEEGPGTYWVPVSICSHLCTAGFLQSRDLVYRSTSMRLVSSMVNRTGRERDTSDIS